MGTRSLTIVKTDYSDEDIIVMYRQMDGYPSGHGADLAAFLDGMKITNGISMRDTGRTANGFDCLAAQIVAHFKDGTGGIYLYPSGSRDLGDAYVYVIAQPRPEDYPTQKGIPLALPSGGHLGLSIGEWSILFRMYQINPDKFLQVVSQYEGYNDEIQIIIKQMADSLNGSASAVAEADFLIHAYASWDNEYHRLFSGTPDEFPAFSQRYEDCEDVTELHIETVEKV